ncbi:unnamed protein product, partial [Ectocarpus sp. 13 AM-2016]
MCVERKMRGPSAGGGRTEGDEYITGDFQGEGLTRAGLQSKKHGRCSVGATEFNI